MGQSSVRCPFFSLGFSSCSFPMVSNKPGWRRVSMGPTKNENGIEDQVKELMQRVERMDITRKMETADLEKKLEAKNTEVENLEKRVKEIEAQKKNQNQEIVASLKSEIEEQCQEKV